MLKRDEKGRMANFHRVFWMTYFQTKIEEKVPCGNIL